VLFNFCLTDFQSGIDRMFFSFSLHALYSLGYSGRCANRIHRFLAVELVQKFENSIDFQSDADRK
jgi:hypothetical protein